MIRVIKVAQKGMRVIMQLGPNQHHVTLDFGSALVREREQLTEEHPVAARWGEALPSLCRDAYVCLVRAAVTPINKDIATVWSGCTALSPPTQQGRCLQGHN